MGIITIKIARLGTTTIEVTVESGSTVAQALNAAGVTVDNATQLRFDGRVVEANTSLNASGTLLLSKQIAGAN
jgi:extradiol dioxygenase family protein